MSKQRSLDSVISGLDKDTRVAIQSAATKDGDEAYEKAKDDSMAAVLRGQTKPAAPQAPRMTGLESLDAYQGLDEKTRGSVHTAALAEHTERFNAGWTQGIQLGERQLEDQRLAPAPLPNVWNNPTQFA